MNPHSVSWRQYLAAAALAGAAWSLLAFALDYGVQDMQSMSCIPPGKKGEPSISGEIHSITFLVNVVCILLASVLLSVGFGSDARWRAFWRTAATLASLLVFAFVLQFLTAYFEVLYGLANRFFATVLIVWLLAISIQLRAVARDSAREA